MSGPIGSVTISSEGRRTRPYFAKSSSTALAVLIGIANLIPEDWSAPLFAIIVVIPITSPREFSSGPPGVARIHRRIRLDRILDRIAARRTPHRPDRRDDSARHRARQAERIADRIHPLPDRQPRADLSQRRRHQVRRVDLQQRQVVAPCRPSRTVALYLCLSDSVTSTRCALSMT